MTAADLTPAQRDRLHRQALRMLRYLGRLTDRMTRCAWSPADPAYRAAHEARDKVQNLTVHLHYATCDAGTAGS